MTLRGRRGLRALLDARKLKRRTAKLREGVPPHPDHDEWWVSLRLAAGAGNVPDLWARLRPVLTPLTDDDSIREVLNQRPEREGTRVMDLHMRGRGATPIEAVLQCYAFLLSHLGDDMPPLEAVLLEPYVEGQTEATGKFALTPFQQRLRAGT